jgi:hypothetical protein
MSYFLAKKLKGIANKMGFRTRLAPPSDALPAISDAVANTAVARDVLVSKADNSSQRSASPVLLVPSLRAGASELLSPQTHLPAQWPMRVASPAKDDRDMLRVAMISPRWVLQIHRIQAALMDFASANGVKCIINHPSRFLMWGHSIVKTKEFLKDNRMFDIEKCVVIGTDKAQPPEQIDYLDPNALPLAPLLVTALLRGDNPKLGTLRKVIDKLKQIRCMAKLLVVGPQQETLDDEEKDKVQKILALSMGEASQLAGIKYDQMIFASSSVKLPAFGMCRCRETMLLKWMKDIENSVKANCNRITRAEELMELRRRVALLMAQ